MRLEDRLAFVERRLLGDHLLELAPDRHVQKIQVIARDHQLDLDRFAALFQIFAAREVLEELDHLVIEMEVLVGVQLPLEELARRKVAVADDDLVTLHNPEYNGSTMADSSKKW